MKSRNTLLLFTIWGLLFAGACGSTNQEEVPSELTPVDEADRTRYNINEDTETVISLDSANIDSAFINQNP